MTNWRQVLGASPDDFCDSLSRSKPDWVRDSISFEDARFLFRSVLERAPTAAVEIGTGSGFSTVVLAHAVNAVAKAGSARDGFRVVTYDVSPYLYFDDSRSPGDAAREILPPDLLEHVAFRVPGTAVDLREEFEADSIEFLFVDAAHDHPWPALDLLATLDRLKPGAIVALHDINLPTAAPESARWGVKYVFDGLELEKDRSTADIPNTGSFTVPEDRNRLRDRLLTILYDYPWELDVGPEVTTRVLA
jgi:predicted O-methyltransferase YrrM